MQWHSAGDVLARLVPDMSFWSGLRFVGLAAGKVPVSCNVLDVAINTLLKNHFKDRTAKFLRRDIYDELLCAYFDTPEMRQSIIEHQNLN